MQILPGHLVPLLVLLGFINIYVVLFCWCNSDTVISALVTLYFKLQSMFKLSGEVLDDHGYHYPNRPADNIPVSKDAETQTDMTMEDLKVNEAKLQDLEEKFSKPDVLLRDLFVKKITETDAKVRSHLGVPSILTLFGLFGNNYMYFQLITWFKCVVATKIPNEGPIPHNTHFILSFDMILKLCIHPSRRSPFCNYNNWKAAAII